MAPSTSSPRSPRRPRRRTALSLITAATFAVIVVPLRGIDLPWADLARHTAYTVLALTLPGTVVHKALRGSMGSWFADLALGTTLGLVLELAAWACFSVLDLRGALWLWPLLTAPLLLVPGTRRRVLSRPDRPWPLLPLTGVVASSLTGVWLIFNGYASRYPLPPTGVPYYPDLLWHMGLAAEARRAFPLGTPQVVGDGTLHYHWFAHAHVAASSLVSGSELPVIWLRLWWVPVVMLGILLTGVLAHRVSGSAWAGALGAALAASTSGWPFWPDVIGSFSNIDALSPSQLFSVPVSLLAMVALVDLVRHPDPGGRRGAATVAALGLAGAAGAKASTLPILVGALGIAFLAALVLRRQRLALLGMGCLATVLAVLGQIAVSGGSAGSGVMLGHALTILRPYRVLVGHASDASERVVDGLVSTPGVGAVLLVGLLVSISFSAARTMALFLPVFQRQLRRDLAAWLLAGACLASLIPFFLLEHRGFSQYYFMYGAIPFGAALWSWSLGDVLRDSRPRQVVAAVTAALMAAVTVWAGLANWGRAAVATAPEMLGSLRSFVTTSLVLLGLLLVISVAAVVRRRSWPGALLPVAPVVLLVPFLVGAVLPNVQMLRHPLATPAPNADTLDEARAADWIARHVPEEDVMATNIHCTAHHGLNCYSLKFWISGLGERRVLIESWRYTPRGAVGGFYDPELYELNDGVFRDPTPATVRRLKDEGVRWLVADRQPDYDLPSPALADHAAVRYANSTITVYELTD